jgi:cytochrome P450
VLAGRRPTHDDLANLSYVRNIFKEVISRPMHVLLTSSSEGLCTQTLRLTPAVPFLDRIALRDDILSGHHIPAGVCNSPCLLLLLCFLHSETFQGVIIRIRVYSRRIFIPAPAVDQEQTVVSVFLMATGRDPTLWKNPEEFNPDRW